MRNKDRERAIANEALKEAAEYLDTARKRLEEWGFVSASQPMILKDYSFFAENFNESTVFPSTAEYIRSASRSSQGTVTELVQTFTSLAAKGSIVTKDPLSATGPGAVAAISTTNSPITVTVTPPALPTITAPTNLSSPTPIPASPGTNILGTDLNGLSSRQAVQQGVNDKIAELLLRYMLQPNERDLVNGERTRILIGVIQVSCSPGWRTRKNYLGDLNISFEYVARVRAEDGSLRNVPSLLWARPTQPDVLAVMPLIDSQTIDMSRDQTNVLALAAMIEASLPGRAASGKLFGESNFDKVFKRNAATRTPIPVINTFTTTTGAGFRFSPSLVALDDPAKADSASANVLFPSTFPAIVVLGVNTDDLENCFKLPYNGCDKGRQFHIGHKDEHRKNTAQGLTGQPSREVPWEDIYVATNVNSRWLLKNSGILPRKQDVETVRYQVARLTDLALEKIAIAQNQIYGDLTHDTNLQIFYTRVMSLQRTAFDLQNRVLGTTNYQPLGENNYFQKKRYSGATRVTKVKPSFTDGLYPGKVNCEAGTKAVVTVNGYHLNSLPEGTVKVASLDRAGPTILVKLNVVSDGIAAFDVPYSGNAGTFVTKGKYVAFYVVKGSGDEFPLGELEVTDAKGNSTSIGSPASNLAANGPANPVGENDVIIRIEKNDDGKISSLTIKQGANVNLSSEALHTMMASATRSQEGSSGQARTAPAAKGEAGKNNVGGSGPSVGPEQEPLPSVPYARRIFTVGSYDVPLPQDIVPGYVSPDPVPPSSYEPQETAAAPVRRSPTVP